MAAPKIFFHDNIRLLRHRRGLTQDMLAEALGCSRVKLNSLESGKTQNPAVTDLIKFSEYFGISVDSLLKVDLGTLGEPKLRELQAGNDVYMTGSKIRVLAITVDKEQRENMEYVPVKAKAGYRAGYADPDYIATLPRFTLPGLPRGYSYRMFPTQGDSMLPIPEGSEVIGRYVQDWKRLKPDTPCILILKGAQDFVFKLVTVQPDGQLLLKSMNTVYAPYTIGSEEVLELWQYYKHQTGTLPEPATGLEELKIMIRELGRKLKI